MSSRVSSTSKNPIKSSGICNGQGGNVNMPGMESRYAWRSAWVLCQVESMRELKCGMATNLGGAVVQDLIDDAADTHLLALRHPRQDLRTARHAFVSAS